MELTQEYIKTILDYDPDTGVFTWLPRPEAEFKTTGAYKVWNKKHMGKTAGSVKGSEGYMRIILDGKSQLGHRLAFLYMTGRVPKGPVDHINGARTDNRFVNLRHATDAINAKNKSIGKNNTSGHFGLTWHEKRGTWQARIWFDGKSKYLGSYKEKSEAVLARKAGEIEHGFHENHGRANV